MKFQFWLVDFELSLAIEASRYCEAVEFWTKTKMKITSYEYGKRREQKLTKTETVSGFRLP